MDVDYRQLCKELFGTDDVDELKRIAAKTSSGRKKKFGSQDIDNIMLLYNNGIGIAEIAKKYGTSRQVVSKYINAPLHDGCTMRMTYMNGQKPCTEIDIDFLNKKIYILNKTADILHRAFGVNEAPDWNDFEEFIEDRCPPRTRGDIKLLLRKMDIDSYDPVRIIERTKGKCTDDKMWIKIRRRGGNYENDQRR